MKLNVLRILFLLVSIKSFASFEVPIREIDSTKLQQYITEKDSLTSDTLAVENVVVYWVEKKAVGVNLNEVAFVNWNTGGNNSVSVLLYGNYERNYKKKFTIWKNSVSLRYGLNAQEGREVRKTEDELRLNSSFGYRRDSISNWYYSAKFNFNSQFSNGYKYPETDRPISKLMAPGYLFLGVGSEYSAPSEELTIYISPVTQKSTFVLDQRLANEGMFGVSKAIRDEEGNIIKKGENVRTEFGFLVTSGFSKEVFENVKFDNSLSLYSDYLNKFGNIDVDWQLNVNMQVNDFVRANIGSHLKYDDDVKYKEDTNGDGTLETSGPRIQFKQMLGVGVVYEF